MIDKISKGCSQEQPLFFNFIAITIVCQIQLTKTE
jgi:hypothetical protein